MGTLSACERCAKEIKEDQGYEHCGKSYCEDCYMNILSPPRACDPWAVYVARSSLQGKDKLSELTSLQRSIVDYVRAKGEVTAKEVTEQLGMTEDEFRREFAALRHMEVLRGTKRDSMVRYTLFDG